MLNYNYPRVFSYMANMLTSNEEVRKTFVKLESALKEKEEWRQTKNDLQRDLQNLQLDVMLIRQTHNSLQAERADTSNCMSILEKSYNYLREIMLLMEDERIENVLRFSILQKQTEVEAQLASIEKFQDNELKCKAAMERRKIVKDFRKVQSKWKDVEEELASIELEDQQFERQWKIKMDRVEQQRNKKIISAVEIRQKILNVQDMKFKNPNAYNINENKSSRAKSPLALQSAFDFLSKYPKEKLSAKDDNNIKTIDQPLRSILVTNRNDNSSPTKQVTFAPLPSPIHEEESFGSLIEQFEENLAEDSPKSSEAEYESFPMDTELPERPIIQKVEILKGPDYSPENDPNEREAWEFSNTNETDKSMTRLSFENCFPSNETLKFSESMERNDSKSTTATFFDSHFDSPEDDDDDDRESSSIDFEAPTTSRNSNLNNSNNFLLNFDDDDITEPRDPRHSYDL